MLLHLYDKYSYIQCPDAILFPTCLCMFDIYTEMNNTLV